MYFFACICGKRWAPCPSIPSSWSDPQANIFKGQYKLYRKIYCLQFIWFCFILKNTLWTEDVLYWLIWWEPNKNHALKESNIFKFSVLLHIIARAVDPLKDAIKSTNILFHNLFLSCSGNYVSTGLLPE